MKRYIYTTDQFTMLVVTVDGNGHIQKTTHYASKFRLSLKRPQFIMQDGTKTSVFDEAQWNTGGRIRLWEEDIFAYILRPKFIPTCNECGVWPVFEHIGYQRNGRQFSQGFNRKCYICEGLEEEPGPWVSDAPTLAQAFQQVVDFVVNAIEEQESIGGPDLDDYDPHTPTRDDILEAMISKEVEVFDFFENLEAEMAKFMKEQGEGE